MARGAVYAGALGNWHSSGFLMPNGVVFDARGDLCTYVDFNVQGTILSANASAAYAGYYVTIVDHSGAVICLRAGIPYGNDDGPSIEFSYTY